MRIKKIRKKFKILAVNNSRVVNNEFLVDTGFLSYVRNCKHMVYETFMLNFFNGNVSHYMFTVFPVWETNPLEEEDYAEEEEDYEGFCPTSVYDDSWLDV